MPVQEVQGFEIQVQTPQLSPLSVEPSGHNCVLSSEQACNQVRVDFKFVIRIKPDNASHGTTTKAKSALTIKLTGNEDKRVRKVKVDVPLHKDTNNTGPGRSKKQDKCASDFSYQWFKLQLEDKGSLERRIFPGSERRVCPLNLAITQRQRSEKRRLVNLDHTRIRHTFVKR